MTGAQLRRYERRPMYSPEQWARAFRFMERELRAAERRARATARCKHLTTEVVELPPTEDEDRRALDGCEAVRCNGCRKLVGLV